MCKVNEPLWSFSDAGMKLVYLIFVTTWSFKHGLERQEKKKTKTKKNLQCHVVVVFLFCLFVVVFFLLLLLFLCMCVLEFYGPVNNEVMSSRSANRALFLGRLRPSKRLTSTRRGRPRQ